MKPTRMSLMVSESLNIDKRTDFGKEWGLGIVLLCLWFGLTYQGLVSAIGIWYISEIFNHCFFAIPISLYLIWEKKEEINWHHRQISLLATPFIFLQVVLYVIGIAGDIQLFQHAAMFSLLPTLIWFFLGNKIAWQIVFPLFFMLFAIPFGEELIPFLQEITADMAVVMVSWTGIPLYRSGLFLEIPQGRFLVAEACSGVSFLIASIVLGNLYAYMSLQGIKTRAAFVLLSLVFPIIANAIRVFGIIVIGYASDMKHAVGADHLIYGWFFFAFVIVCLLGLGEVIRRWEKRRLAKDGSNKSIAEAPENDATTLDSASLDIVNSDSATKFEKSGKTLTYSMVVILILLAGVGKSISLKSAASTVPQYPNFTLPFQAKTNGNRLSTWQPEFAKADKSDMATVTVNSETFVYYWAYFDGTESELISFQNSVFGEDRWSLESKRKEALKNEINANVWSLRASNGGQIQVYHAYVIDGKVFTDNRKAKLYQVWLKLQGKPYDGFFVAISKSPDGEAKSLLDNFSMTLSAFVSGFNLRSE